LSSPAFDLVRAGQEHGAAWCRLQHALWPDATPEEHQAGIARQLTAAASHVAFLALGEDGSALALAEAALRQDPVNGCGEPPVAFLEGLYVIPAVRRLGLARRLLQAVEAWARSHACSELGSDVEQSNSPSQVAHLGLGFEETERVVFYHKRL
jgi:aminoglycoside 6'-N-acetyltransferase I